MTHEKDAQSRRACRFQNELYADYYLGAILYLANDADLHVVHKQSGASWVARVGEVLRNLQVPTMLIWGTEDAITPLWRDIPEGARLAAIPYAGHLCYAEQPELFNTIVREFLREDHRR